MATLKQALFDYILSSKGFNQETEKRWLNDDRTVRWTDMRIIFDIDHLYFRYVAKSGKVYTLPSDYLRRTDYAIFRKTFEYIYAQTGKKFYFDGIHSGDIELQHTNPNLYEAKCIARPLEEKRLYEDLMNEICTDAFEEFWPCIHIHHDSCQLFWCHKCCEAFSPNSPDTIDIVTTKWSDIEDKDDIMGFPYKTPIITQTQEEIADYVENFLESHTSMEVLL